jgi:hypothetical protein
LRFGGAHAALRAARDRASDHPGLARPLELGGADCRGVRGRWDRTEWVDRYDADPQAVVAERGRLAAELVDAVRAGRGHELVPFTGQSAGIIDSVRPAGEIVVEIVAEADELLARYR